MNIILIQLLALSKQPVINQVLESTIKWLAHIVWLAHIAEIIQFPNEILSIVLLCFLSFF